MSSRVQKGGQKFKPVLKPRGRQADASPDPPRKPLSARGATVEPSVLHPRNEAQHRVSRLQSVPLSAGVSASEQRDVSALKPNGTIHDGQTHEAVGLGSVGGIDHEYSATAVKTDGSDYSRAVADVTTRPPGALDADSLPVRPDASSSRQRHVPSVQRSRATSVVQQPASAPASEALQPEPTLHSMLQGVSPIVNGPIEATLSLQVPADTRAATMLETNCVATGDQPGVSAAPNRRRGGNSRRRSRAGDAADMKNAVDASEMAGGDDLRTENCMRRKRKLSTQDTSNSPSKQTQSASNHVPRRSNRVRQATSVRSVAQEQSDTGDAQSSESEPEPQRRKRRRSSTVSSATITKRRKSRNSVVFDPDGDPGEELDPTVVTMATICNDTGQGRISSKTATIQRNHSAWKAANKQKRERLRARMEAKKYGRQDEEDDAHAQSMQPVKELLPDENDLQLAESFDGPAVVDASGNGFNYQEAHAVSRFSARVRIGPSGETIVDEESLYVDRAENVDAAAETYQHVEESDQTKFTNSASYGRKLRGSRWSAEETELFYDALSQFGENYELISYVLPGRDRKACKAKFKAEDRKNTARITYCLNNRIPYDIQTLSRLTGKDFSGPTPEIRTPEIPEPVKSARDQQSEAERQSESEPSTRKVRKRSKTPTITDDVEIVGDIETFEGGASDG